MKLQIINKRKTEPYYMLWGSQIAFSQEANKIIEIEIDVQPLLRQVSFKNCTRFRGRDEQEGGEPALCFD